MVEVQQMKQEMRLLLVLMTSKIYFLNRFLKKCLFSDEMRVDYAVWCGDIKTTPHCMSPHHTILKNLKGKNALLFQILANNIHFLKFF